MDKSNNQIVEYMTSSGDTLWVPAMGAMGISSTIVPTSESAKEIRLYDKDGAIIGDFKADPKAVPPRWEPFISPDGALIFERTTGTQKDVWEVDHSIRPFARLSGDEGQTWTAFKGIVTANPVVPIPQELKTNQDLLVDVYCSRNMNIEVRRFRISLLAGAKGILVDR